MAMTICSTDPAINQFNVFVQIRERVCSLPSEQTARMHTLEGMLARAYDRFHGGVGITEEDLDREFQCWVTCAKNIGLGNPVQEETKDQRLGNYTIQHNYSSQNVLRRLLQVALYWGHAHAALFLGREIFAADLKRL